MKTWNLAAASAALVLLAACGGSSPPPPPAGKTIGYSGPTTAATLSGASDKNALASSAAALAQGFSGATSGATGFAAGARQTPAFVKDALALAASVRDDVDLGATVSGATATLTASCDGGGSMSVSMQDADGVPTTAHAGDTVQVSFASCDDGGGNVTNGSLRVTIDSTSAPGDDFVAAATSITKDVSFGLTLAFTHFWTIDAMDAWSGMNGSLSVAFTADYAAQTLAFQVSGTLVEGASGVGSTVTEAFRLAPLQGASTFHERGTETYTGMGTAGATAVETSWDLDARVCALELAGCLNLQTDPSFAQREVAVYPYAGALKVYDDAGDFVQVAATNEDGSVTLSWLLDGVSGSKATTWACLEDPAGLGCQ